MGKGQQGSGRFADKQERDKTLVFQTSDVKTV